MDEAHHDAASSYRTIRDFYTPRFRGLFSATLERGDKLPIFSDEDPGTVVFFRPLAWAAENGYVKKPFYTALAWNQLTYQEVVDELMDIEEEVSIEPSAKKLKANEKKAIHAFKPLHNFIASETLKRVWMMRGLTGQPHVAIAKCRSKAQAYEVLKSYRRCEYERRVSAEVIHSGLGDKEIEGHKKDFLAGKIDVLLVVDMLGEGYDNPLISVTAWHCIPNKKTGMQGVDAALAPRSPVDTSALRCC